jgi:hypothetical protein
MPMVGTAHESLSFEFEGVPAPLPTLLNLFIHQISAYQARSAKVAGSYLIRVFLAGYDAALLQHFRGLPFGVRLASGAFGALRQRIEEVDVA